MEAIVCVNTSVCFYSGVAVNALLGFLIMRRSNETLHTGIESILDEGVLA